MEGPPADVPWLAPRPDVAYNAPFREAVDAFLGQYGEAISGLALPNVAAWVVPLASATEPAVRTRLHVYEERADEAAPAVCDPCRIIGAPPDLTRTG